MNFRITLILLLLICFAEGLKAQAMKADQSLWGLWRLESINQLRFDDGRISIDQENSINTILKTENTSIQDIFTAIHFFDDFTVGICSLKKEMVNMQKISGFLPQNINTKGLYQLEQNRITIKIQDEKEMEFGLIYKVNNNTLEIFFRNTENDERDDQKMVFLKND